MGIRCPSACWFMVEVKPLTKLGHLTRVCERWYFQGTVHKANNRVRSIMQQVVWYGMVWYGMVWYGMVWGRCNSSRPLPFAHPQVIITIVTREGWPLPWLLKTEMNGGSKSTNERGPSQIGSLGLSCRYKRFLFCLGCSSQPSTKYIFLSGHYINFLFPTAQASWAGSRAGSSVSQYVSLIITTEGGDLTPLYVTA